MKHAAKSEPVRGVIEESSPRDDERVFSLRDHNGNWRGTVRLPADEATPDAIQKLWRELDDRDPPAPTLRLER